MALLTWNPEQKLAFLNLQFKLQRQQYRASFADAEFLVVLRENQPIGRFYLRRGAEYYQLIDISLLPEHRGGGVGTGLLVNLLAEAGTLAVPVRLHVTAHNRANKFYQRLGFVVREEQQIYLGMEWKP